MGDNPRGDLLSCGHYEGYEDIEEGCLMCRVNESREEVELLKKKIVHLESQVDMSHMDAFLERGR